MQDVQFQVDSRGETTAVVVPVKGRKRLVAELLEDIYGHEMIRQRRREKRIGADELVKRLRRDGLL